jgi:hypothetical protein
MKQKARRFVHLDTSIIKPYPEFDKLARNDYVFGVCFTTRRGKIRAAVSAVENRDQFDFSSISGDIKPSEKEATKLLQMIKKIAKPDP